MNRSRLLLALLLGVSAFPAFACAAPTDEGEGTDSQDDEIKKKVKPKGANGALDLVAPDFNAAGYVGTFQFGGTAIKAGDRVEKVPGAYSLVSIGTNLSDGVLMSQVVPFTITAGTIARHQLGGLRVRFAAPITLGAARVDLAPSGGGSGYLTAGGPWMTAPNGASMLALAGTVGVTPSTEGTKSDVVITEGALTEMVLPIANVTVQLDAYDAAYPTPSCAAPYVRGGVTGSTTSAYVRKSDGSPNASFVVPQGSRAPVVLHAYGIELSQATAAGQTHTFTLNRLEIDDVEVTQAAGGTKLVSGTVTVSRKNADGTYTNLSCTFPTRSGIDLPDGSYRIVSRAQAPSGLVTSTDEVTFP